MPLYYNNISVALCVCVCAVELAGLYSSHAAGCRFFVLSGCGKHLVVTMLRARHYPAPQLVHIERHQLRFIYAILFLS